MKKLKLLAKFAATAAFLSIVLTGCPGLFPEDSNGTNSSNGSNSSTNNEDTDKPISGTLTGDTVTWPGEDDEGEIITYYIKPGVTYTIKNGGKLIIEEGAIIKMGAGSKIEVGIGGTLEATGAIFTSAKDPRGRTIKAAGQDAPAAADWKNIYINGGHGELYNCEISYGGSGCSTVNVEKNGSSYGSCKIDGCKFTYNSGTNSVTSTVNAAVRYASTLIYGEDNTLTNTTFENNIWPITLPVKFSVSGNNHFGTGDKANKFNLIHLFGDYISGEVVLEHTEVPYLYATGNNFDIGGTSTNGKLTIKGGDADHPTVVEFYQKGFRVYDKTGLLVLENYIHFTRCDAVDNQKYNGIYCYKRKVPYVDNNGKDQTYTGYVLLTTNTSENIEIDGYEVTGYDKPWKNDEIQLSNSTQ